MQYGEMTSKLLQVFLVPGKYRECLVSRLSPIGDSLRVTSCRIVRGSLDQTDRKRKHVSRKEHNKRKTRAGKRMSPVLRKTIIRTLLIRQSRNTQSLTEIQL